MPGERYDSRRPRLRSFLFCLLLAVSAGTLEAQGESRRCADTPVDSSDVGGPVYRDCHVDRVARMRGSEPRLYWNPPRPEGASSQCFRAEFEFVVDTLGNPELTTLRDIKATHTEFANAVRESIAQLRYQPAQRGGVPVRQWVQYRRTAATFSAVSVSSGPVPVPPPSPPRPPRC